MQARRIAGQTIGILVAIVVVSLLAGQLLGQPVLLSYVETGSMAPTLEPGDGFIAVPMAVAGPIEEGDVVTFNAVNLHGGGLTTHRVVGRTEAGYITQGDANLVTDQGSGDNEPPVQRQQIVAKALQIGGDVVVLPGLGRVVLSTNDALNGVQLALARLFGTRALLGTQGLSYLLFGIGVAIYVVSLLVENQTNARPERDTGRKTDTVNMSVVVAVLTVILLVTTTATMVVPSGTHTFEIISSDSDAPGARVIPKGGSENLTYQVPSSGILPAVVYLSPGGDGLDVEPRELYVPSSSTANATVTLHAPPQTGYYQRYLVERRYLAVLPTGVIRALYAIHPWMPLLAINAFLGGAFVAVGTALVGSGRVRMRSRSRSRGGVLTRVQRWLR